MPIIKNSNLAEHIYNRSLLRLSEHSTKQHSTKHELASSDKKKKKNSSQQESVSKLKQEESPAVVVVIS